MNVSNKHGHGDEDDHENFSFTSKGSSRSAGWGKRKAHRNMTTQWRQLYLSRAKLKAISRTSALIAGFAMVAMVEVQLDRSVEYDDTLLILFSFTTTCLVAVHLFALMIATCMLPNIEAISNIHNAKAIDQSPHHKMRRYIEVAWILSTGVGLVLFLIEIALLIWLKFQSIYLPDSTNQVNATTHPKLNETAMTPAIVATALLVPVVVLFVAFAIHFYKTLAHHRYTIFEDAVTELDRMVKNHEGTFLHPNAGDHLAISRQPSGLSTHSMDDRHSYHVPQHDIHDRSRLSSFSGQFSVDPV